MVISIYHHSYPPLPAKTDAVFNEEATMPSSLGWQWHHMKSFLFWAIMGALQISWSSSEASKISSLPGQPRVGFQQYSGYVTVDRSQNEERRLFYYFVEAETDPKSKPLVLWLNGGPGCSSVGAGAFSEHGPFRTGGNELSKNDYSWNREANMLYLETPAGVGFSYSVNKSYYNFVNDDMTARDNLRFLELWLEEFPEYKKRDFFITGESYGGHYVPTLAKAVLNSPLKSNLKGIAIGNPLLEFNTDFNSVGDYYWSHGLVSDSTHEMLGKLCNFSQIRRQAQKGSFTPDCATVVVRANGEIGKFVDAYDVLLDRCPSSISSQAALLSATAHPISQKPDPCLETETTEYLNRKDVQEALHAKLVGVGQWAMCSNILKYDTEDEEVPTIPILGTLVKSGVRVLVYSGDQDSVIPLLGTRKLVNGLAEQMGLKTTVPYRFWLHGKEVGGWTQVYYGNMLSYATIRGAAHEAPFSQPGRSFALFSSFLAGKPLPGTFS